MSELRAIDTVVGKAEEGDAGWVWYQNTWRLGQISRSDHPEDERLYLDLVLDEGSAWFHVDDPKIWGLGFYPISRPPYEGNEHPCTHALTFRDQAASWTMTWSMDEEQGAAISRSIAAHVQALLRIGKEPDKADCESVEPGRKSQAKLWYHTQDPDSLWHGKCSSREEAIAEGCDEHDGEDFYVAWATNDPIRLADWIGVDDIIEHAEDALSDSDRVCSEYDDAGVFSTTPAQERDLIERIKAVCDQWQADHKLVFACNTFSTMGEPELIRGKESGE